MLRSNTIKSGDDIEFIIFEEGRYRNPIAVISDYEAMMLVPSFIQGLPRDKLETIVRNLVILPKPNK